MKRTPQQILEYESILELRKRFPSEWIVREKNPDVGIDLEVEIVEGGEISNKVIWIQVKASVKPKTKKVISYQMETKHLKYYQNSKLPVIIFYYIKSEDTFYYLFSQEYINEILSPEDTKWRDKKTKNIKFPPDSIFTNPEDLVTIATKGHLYVIQKQLELSPRGAHYWLDGIPQSDDKVLKDRNLKALKFIQKEDHKSAITELESILRDCTTSPTERMSILLNLGNSYYNISNNDKALENYKSILGLSDNMDKKSALEGKSYALGNIGVVYRDKGELDNALKFHLDALVIDREIGYRQGEANQLGNIGVIYHQKGDLDNALKQYRDALVIHRETCHLRGEASDIAGIGMIYHDKGDWDNAIKQYQDALAIHRETFYLRGEASVLNHIGLAYRARGDLDNALKQFLNSLEIDRGISNRLGEASDLGNIGLVYSTKGNWDDALKKYQEALVILREIGYRLGEASVLGNIGQVFCVKGDLDNALKQCQDSLEIHRQMGSRQGEANQLGNIGLVYKSKGDSEKALTYLKDALKILDDHNLVYGQDVFQKAIDSITKNTQRE